MTEYKTPNFLIIVADDLGYSDTSPFGGEIETPNLQKLSDEGLRMLDFHSAAACSPTRAMLMTGTDAHLAGLGVMAERKPQNLERWGGRPGYEGFMNKNVAALPEILQDNGYHTLLSGKWHLGLRPEFGPSARGFDKSFSMLLGCCNHFMWEPQWKRDGGINPRPLHVEDGVRCDLEPNKTSDPKHGHYSSDLYVNKLISYFENRTSEEKEKPWFAYLPFTAPHWPSQAPQENISKYKDKYDEGPYVLRQRRLERLKKMGLMDENTIPHEVVCPDHFPEWDAMTPEQRLLSARSYAAYAGMVDRMDWNIGRIMDYLKSKDEWNDTFVLFMSDNGSEGAAWEALPVMGPQLMKTINAHYDNSLDNIGNYNSFTWIGPLWAQASTAPSRLFKEHSSEGGILVPCIVKHASFRPELQMGQASKAFSTCMDIAPTILEMAGVKHPAADVSEPTISAEFRGRTVYGMRGSSWVPYMKHKKLASEADAAASKDLFAIHPPFETVGWELYAVAALRRGQYKILHELPMWGGVADGDEGWQLYDLIADPGETKDLSDELPKIKQELIEEWQEYVGWSGTVWGDEAAASIPADRDTSLLFDDPTDFSSAWMQTQHGQVPKFSI